MSNRFLRNKDLIDQSKLTDLTIIGAGGIGSSLIINATIMGFRQIAVWDHDILEEHNLSTTVYPEEYLGTKKAVTAGIFASRFNNNVNIISHAEKWFSTCDISDMVFVCTDDMESRWAAYKAWRNRDTRIFFIDMRMGALSMEIITTTRNHDYYGSTWQTSEDIPDEACTMKHTIFTGSIASGYGLSQAFNVLQDMRYYAYIWMSLSPNIFRRDKLVLTQ